MSKKTDELLKIAKDLNNPDLDKAIEAFEAVENITANHLEYDELKALVESVENSEDDQDPEKQTEVLPENNEKHVEKVEPVKEKLSMFGIRMIGGKWYSKKDGRKRGFDTSRECAEHFNRD